jgi:cytidyltransferase-like protein
MKRVITFGVFDLFHYGHLKLFQNIKKICGPDTYLIVAVQKDEWVKKYKPQTTVLYSLDQRMEIVSSLNVVDEVIPYTNVEDTIQTIEFDIFAKGPDQQNEKFVNAIRYAEEKGKKVITIPRTPNICSLQIKTNIR